LERFPGSRIGFSKKLPHNPKKKTPNQRLDFSVSIDIFHSFNYSI
jgi:hypothetical protein